MSIRSSAPLIAASSVAFIACSGGWGIGILAAGLTVMLARSDGFDRLSLTLLAVGWAILIGVIIQRTRYHHRRMSGNHQE